MTERLDTHPSIAVVFLARGIDNGASNSESFFESYDRFRPQIPHRLTVVVKGWDGIDGLDRVCEGARSRGGRIERLPDDGFDWGAYRRVAALLSEDFICFLNGNSRIVAPNWLNAMANALQRDEIGAVGATGSYATLSPHMISHWIDWPMMPFRYARMAPLFPGFPNPHLRSNAFMTRRDLFVAYVSTRDVPRKKIEAHVMECGRDGFCRFLAKHGKRFVVTGRDEVIYPPDAWIQSNTFCTENQENLLIADNRTEQYQRGDRATRTFLERAIWGRRLEIP